MNDLEDEVRRKARQRVAKLFNLTLDSVELNAEFGKDLKASFVSDFKSNEFEQIDRDIKDVADKQVLKDLGSGTLVIRTVNDYCEHMVRCLRTNRGEVTRLLGMEAK